MPKIPPSMFGKKLTGILVRLLNNPRVAASLSIGMIITIFLVFILGAAVLPTAFSQWFNANTTGWPTATQTLWPLVPLLGVVALIAIVAYKAQHKGKEA